MNPLGNRSKKVLQTNMDAPFHSIIVWEYILWSKTPSLVEDPFDFLFKMPKIIPYLPRGIITNIVLWAL